MARVITEVMEGGHLYRFGNELGVNGSASVALCGVGGVPLMDGARCLEMGAFDSELTMPVPSATEYFIGAFFVSQDPTLVFSGFLGSGSAGNHRILVAQQSGVNIATCRINPLTEKFELLIENTETLVASSTQLQVITAGTLYHAQMRVFLNGVASVVQVKLDDVLVIDWTGTLSATLITRFNFCGGGRSFADNAIGAAQWFDDIVINDTTASTCTDNTWPGVLRFKVQNVTGPGTYAQFTADPAVANYLNVDDLPHDGDTTTNYALTTGLKDSFPTSPAGLSAANVTFKAWFQEVIARKSSGTFKIKLGVRRAGVDYIEATGHDVGVSFDVFDSRRCQDPSSLSSWTEAGLDATEIIYQID